MKHRFSAVVAAVLFLAMATAMAVLPQGDLFTAGELTNPTINTTLADTGAMDQELGLGAYMVVTAWCSTTVNANFRYSIRNAAGTEVAAKSFNFRVLANTMNGPPMNAVSFKVPQGYSVRIVNPAAITGTVQCVIMTGLDQVIVLSPH